MDRYQALRDGQPPKYVGRCRNIPRDEARARDRGRRAGGRFASACRTATARSRSTISCAARVVSDRRHRRLRAPALGRRPRLQLRRRRRRCADGDHARDSRRGSHLEHAAAAAALRGVRLDAAALRARVDGAGPRSRDAVEAARRDVGRRVSRARLPAGGAGELPGADRLVARREARSCCRSTSWRGASASRTSARAPACSIRRSSRG